MPHPALSIIMPIYRAEQYIQSTLLSLLNQSCEDYEIICIDDCGGDKSVQIIQTIQSSHSLGYKIRLVSMGSNVGAAQARNFGLQHAQGTYIAFVDADDWCEDFMYQSLLDAAQEHQADWAFCNAQKEFENGHSEVITQSHVLSGPFNIESKRRFIVDGIALFWTGIYRRDFLMDHAIAFPNYKFSEDSFFVWMVVMHAQRVAYVDKVGYHYRIVQSSISNRPDPNKSKIKMQLFQHLIEEIKEHNLYLNYREELDYLYLKKGLLIPMLIDTLDVDKQLGQNSLRDCIIDALIPLRKNVYFLQNKRLQGIALLLQYFPWIIKLLKPFIKRKVIL